MKSTNQLNETRAQRLDNQADRRSQAPSVGEETPGWGGWGDWRSLVLMALGFVTCYAVCLVARCVGRLHRRWQKMRG
jgi:hypothetical protein